MDRAVEKSRSILQPVASQHEIGELLDQIRNLNIVKQNKAKSYKASEFRGV